MEVVSSTLDEEPSTAATSSIVFSWLSSTVALMVVAGGGRTAWCKIWSRSRGEGCSLVKTSQLLLEEIAEETRRVPVTVPGSLEYEELEWSSKWSNQ